MRLCILVGVCSRLNLFTGSNLGAVSLVTVNGLISAPFHSTGILSGPSHKFLFCFVLFVLFFASFILFIIIIVSKTLWRMKWRKTFFKNNFLFFFCTFYFQDTKIWFAIINELNVPK